MFKIKNEAGRNTLYIYGTIGEDYWSSYDENRAKDIAQTLDDLSPAPLDIHIDSSGGDVYEGFAIASAIQRYEGETCAYIDGMAASAASYIALMADRVVMNSYAFFMIHNAWSLTIGNRDELRETADRLEQIDEAIASIIEARTFMSLEEVKDAMTAETWYSGEEALAVGMCDEVIETEERIAACIDKRIANRFKNTPKNVAVSEANEDSEVKEVEEEEAELEEVEDESISYSVNTIEDDGTVAEKALVLGNRIYRRKENDAKL